MANEQNLLQDRVETAISNSPYLTGRKFRFETKEGCVTLMGEVNTYFQKQMAQESLRSIEGVDKIENDLEVNWS